MPIVGRMQRLANTDWIAGGLASHSSRVDFGRTLCTFKNRSRFADRSWTHLQNKTYCLQQ